MRISTLKFLLLTSLVFFSKSTLAQCFMYEEGAIYPRFYDVIRAAHEYIEENFGEEALQLEITRCQIGYNSGLAPLNPPPIFMVFEPHRIDEPFYYYRIIRCREEDSYNCIHFENRLFHFQDNLIEFDDEISEENLNKVASCISYLQSEHQLIGRTRIRGSLELPISTTDTIENIRSSSTLNTYYVRMTKNDFEVVVNEEICEATEYFPIQI